MSTACIDTRSTRAIAIADLDWLDRRERMPAARDESLRGAWRSLVARLQWGPVASTWSEPCGASLDDASLMGSPASSAAASPLAAAVRALGAPWHAWRRHRRIEAGIDALRELDDHLLRDLGIERADIARAAHGLPLARRR